MKEPVSSRLCWLTLSATRNQASLLDPQPEAFALMLSCARPFSSLCNRSEQSREFLAVAGVVPVMCDVKCVSPGSRAA